jgi:hypothetical protein
VGMLQIGIRAWLQHFAYLGSWTSCAETPSKVLLKGVTLYPNPPYQKPKLRIKIPIVCMHLKNMNYVLIVSEYNVD